MLTAAAGALIAAALGTRDARNPRASDSEEITWGATDPAWSPDGKRLAFSLFGSIWQVPVEGGIAEQVSSSPGYHAHPAWDPRGGRIAFVSGAAPAGAKANVSGKLMLSDLATGRERELPTPYPAAGTPAWSPDGAKIACGLSVPDAGSLLYEIGVATEEARPMQFRPQRPRGNEWERLKIGVGPWIDAAWSPARDEIFFAAEHIGAPQIWSMPSRNPAITIALPLTAYRQRDIVWLNSISAFPDGSGVVYSADLQNGRGNYELYRVPRAGGKPVPLTNTSRDEFSPAVSPDGRRIAHVSNHMGNIDLFLMPAGGGEKEHVAIAGLKFRGQSAKVRVQVRDEMGRPTAARLYVEASDGKSYAPRGSPIYYYPRVRGGARSGFFIASGDDTFAIPAGRLRLVASKGVEYHISGQTAEIPAESAVEISIAMRRWTDWNRRGWYAGENHFHANYNGSYYQRPKQSLRWLEAEDLNVANMIVANKDGAFLHDQEFFRGAVDPLSTARYILYWGQEYRNSDPLGHMVFLNLKTLVPPYFTSVVGSNSPYDYPLNTTAALNAKRQGGFVSYTHPMVGRTNDVFDTWLGAKEAPVVAALGGVDSIDIMPTAEHSADLWYSLLNCGFRIAPGAGTDVFTNWRGINGIPGSAREYVEVGPAMKWASWLARYRAGRVFVTNGPLLTFEMNGNAMGAEVSVPAGQIYAARLSATVQARDPLETVELLQNGEVIERWNAEAAATSMQVAKEVTVDRSCWFAIRVSGRAARGVSRETGGTPRAYSGPIYVRAGGAPALVKQDVELMIRWIDRLWAYLDERDNFGPAPNRSEARKLFDQARRHYQAKLTQAH
jgi:TolB protein